MEKIDELKKSSKSAAEIKKWYEENKDKISRYEEANDGLTFLTNITKTSTKAITAFSKDKLRTYLQNIGSNQSNLRKLSRYLYYRSQVYYRLIKYFSNQFDLNSRSVIPQYSPLEEPNPDDMLSSYYETISVLDKLNLQYEMVKALTICFREDVFYGCAYYDETSMFVLPLDPDYCKIAGIYPTGDFAFAMNMSYFGQRQELLEYWGEPFESMYKEYEKDTTNGKWQMMPDEYCVCFKARAEDWDTVVPVFSGMFNSIISLIDLEDIQAIADEQQIYKLIWMELETLTGTDQPDDWKVTPKLATRYFNKFMDEALPDYTTATVVPGKLNTISFDNDQATDSNKIEKATTNVLNSSGGAQVLNSASISGTTAFNTAIRSDAEFAISMLLPQIEAWVNRFLTYHISNPSKVKFFAVSVYTKEALKESLRTDAQYGLPVKLALNTLNGFSENDTLALNYLEENCLKLSEKFVPLSSSYTQSGSAEGGGQTKSDTGGEDSLTDDGEASRDKRDRAKG